MEIGIKGILRHSVMHESISSLRLHVYSTAGPDALMKSLKVRMLSAMPDADSALPQVKSETYFEGTALLYARRDCAVISAFKQRVHKPLCTRMPE